MAAATAWRGSSMATRAGFAEQGARSWTVTASERLTAESRATLARHAGRLDDRRRQGLVRECHGDLHLRNICLVDGVPTLFDAVEFNDEISCIDVLYDLAFLLMDLWRRRSPVHANLVFNEYLARTRRPGRPAVAAVVSFVSRRRSGEDERDGGDRSNRTSGNDADSHAASREYLALAQELLRPRCAVPDRHRRVLGLRASRRSPGRLAPAVGVAPGALVLRSDVIRKTLLGVSPMTRLGPEGYTADVNGRVYRTMADA